MQPPAPGKGAAWADCRIARVREDGLYDVRVLPTPGSSVRKEGQCTGVPRGDLRKRAAKGIPFPQRSSCAAVGVHGRIVVFGGLQVASNKRLDDTWLLRFKFSS